MNALFNAPIIRLKSGEYVGMQEYARLVQYAQRNYFGTLELESVRVKILSKRDYLRVAKKYKLKKALGFYDSNNHTVYINASPTAQWGGACKSIGGIMNTYFHEIGHYISHMQSVNAVTNAEEANPIDYHMVSEGIAEDFAFTTLMSLAS